MPDLKPNHYEATGNMTSSGLMNPGRALMRLVTSGGLQSRLSILIYHRVLPQQDPLFPEEVDAALFDRHMGHLVACFKVLPLRDAVRRLRNGTLPHNAACVTFDDGYADNAEVALPILQKHGITATFFVATGFLNGGRMWNDTIIELVRRTPGPVLNLDEAGLGRFEIETLPQRRQAISALLNALKYLPLESRRLRVEEIAGLIPVIPRNDLMMTSDQIRLLHNAGMEIGGHTATHPILARMDNGAARAEIADGRDALQSLIRAPVHLFAYPNGKPGQDYLPDHVAMIKSLGFEAAVSTAWGAASRRSDFYQLPRFTPWDRGRVGFALRMAQNMLRSAQTV